MANNKTAKTVYLKNTKTNSRSLWSKFFGQRRNLTLVAFVVVFGAIGVYFLISGHAEPFYGQIANSDGRCMNNLNGKALDLNNIVLAECNSQAPDQWRYNTNGTITNEDGFCLDVYHSGVTANTPVDLYDCNGTVAQQWIVDSSVGTITNPHSGYCLGSNTVDFHTFLEIQPCYGLATQKWSVSTGATRQPIAATTTRGETVAACSKATGPFTISRTNIIDGNGDVFVPYGASLSTLQYYPKTYLDSNTTESTLAETEAQIKAIADSWCGNTVRLQIEQDELVGVAGSSLNTAYLNVIKAAVSYAEGQGLAIVINDQAEPGGPNDVTNNEPLPTTASEEFWRQMNKLYANDPQIVYDLFNEPRLLGPSEEAQAWQYWLNGGKYQGVQYIGLQSLATYVRNDGSKNLFWVEGPLSDGTLDYIINNPSIYEIKGAGPIVYSVHHAWSANAANESPATWDAAFGDMVKDNIAPVVDGEWTNYANSTGECWPDAPTAVPAFLTYLQNEGIGMTVWTLGRFMTTNGSYGTPSQIDPSTWSCTSGLGQGAGQFVQNWYKQQNS